MIQIYCLVDPRNNRPFYVGATKVLLKNRLSGHISNALSFHPNEYTDRFPTKNKHAIVLSLLNENKRPLIKWLYTCDIYSVDFYERFFYNVLTAQGFTLLNCYLSFDYTKYKKIPHYNFFQNT